MPEFRKLAPVQLAKPTTNSDAPQAVCPNWLSGEALDVWAILAPVLNPTAAETFEFACYCEAVAEFMQATKDIKHTGLTTTDADGTPIANPVIVLRDKADSRVHRWAGRFNK